jgi:hypothetical protein
VALPFGKSKQRGSSQKTFFVIRNAVMDFIFGEDDMLYSLQNNPAKKTCIFHKAQITSYFSSWK